MTDNVDICTSEVELLEIIRKVEISRLQILIRNWKILIFADVLLIMLNVGVIYYKILTNWYVTLITFIIQFLVVLIGVIFVILLKREIRKYSKSKIEIEIEKPEFKSKKINLCTNRGPTKGKCPKGGR